MKYARIFFGLCLVLILYLFYRMIEPFVIALILAMTAVTLFYPNYRRLNRQLRDHRNFSSLIMCTVMTLLVILPLMLFFIALFNELNAAYVEFRMQLANAELVNLETWKEDSIVAELWSRLARYLGVEEQNLPLAFSMLVDQGAKYILDHYSAILGGVGTVALQFSIVIFSMFFLFRDGELFLLEVRKLIPLAPHYEEMVLAKLRDVVYATFFGIFATGILQGVVAGLIFLALGIKNPVLWGTATAFFSLVPVVGTAAVWVPMSIWLILNGFLLKGVLLLILGATVIGLVDNVVRPLIIEEKSGGMHLLLVFFSLLGGLTFFGPAGLVVGPLVAALLVTFLEIYKIEFDADLS